MLDLPFNLDDPPRDPPSGVAEPLLWRTAIRLRDDHCTVRRDAVGLTRCVLCRQAYPCVGWQLAHRGLLAACRPYLRDGGTRASVDRILVSALVWPRE